MNSSKKRHLSSNSSASDLIIDAKLEEHQLSGSKHCPGCGHKLQRSKPVCNSKLFFSNLIILGLLLWIRVTKVIIFNDFKGIIYFSLFTFHWWVEFEGDFVWNNGLMTITIIVFILFVWDHLTVRWPQNKKPIN